MKQETIDRIRKFTEDREWEQFHSPGNLAKSIVIEAAELLECFQWNDKEYDLQHVKEELADVMVYSQNMVKNRWASLSGRLLDLIWLQRKRHFQNTWMKQTWIAGRFILSIRLWNISFKTA